MKFQAERGGGGGGGSGAPPPPLDPPLNVFRSSSMASRLLGSHVPEKKPLGIGQVSL